MTYGHVAYLSRPARCLLLVDCVRYDVRYHSDITCLFCVEQIQSVATISYAKTYYSTQLKYVT